MQWKLEEKKSVIATAHSTETIDSVIRKMANKSWNIDIMRFAGFMPIVDESNRLVGVVSDGDIRKAYARDDSFEKKIDTIMNKEPLVLTLKKDQSIQSVKEDEQYIEIVAKAKGKVRYIPIVNQDGSLIDIHDLFDAYSEEGFSNENVNIYGMGFVGLTLGVYLAGKGIHTLGVEKSESLVVKLKKGEAHIQEPLLETSMHQCMKNETLQFANLTEIEGADIHIISVGTPLDNNGNPGMTAMVSCLDAISKILKKGDHIFLRSTVPCGITRKEIIPYLEKLTGFKSGTDFYISFCPERTVEGNALAELAELPQIVGSLNRDSMQKARLFWSKVGCQVVEMPSIEAAELVKLANNTFRDLSFAFSNQLAELASQHNIDAFELIKLANEGYKRNKIAFPSPGVGGYCLTKDPILYSASLPDSIRDESLGFASRKANERAAKYPLRLVNAFRRVNSKKKLLKVLIIGLAFKGLPETSDIRGSVALELINELKKMNDINIYAWDAVIDSLQIDGVVFHNQEELQQQEESFDIIMIMNNHPMNAKLLKFAKNRNERQLVFDGWHQYDGKLIGSISNMIYATMGFTSCVEIAKVMK